MWDQEQYLADLPFFLKHHRANRDAEQDWQELREWSQRYKAKIRFTAIAEDAGISKDVISVLLLRDPEKVSFKIGRDFDRLDAILVSVMSPPYSFRPSWLLMGQR